MLSQWVKTDDRYEAVVSSTTTLLVGQRPEGWSSVVAHEGLLVHQTLMRSRDGAMRSALSAAQRIVAILGVGPDAVPISCPMNHPFRNPPL